MKKRILSLLLAIALLLPCLPVQPAQAEITSREDMESIIAAQYDAYVKSLKAEGASEGAAQLIKHSIKGGGTLHMDENDKFTKALLSSQLLRDAVIHSTSAAIEYLQQIQSEKIFLRGRIDWYENDFSYSNYAYSDNENGNDEDDALLSPLIHVSNSLHMDVINSYDESMVLVGGYCQHRFTVERIAATADSFTYKVSIRLLDGFDFTGANYSNKDSGLADTLTWLGRLLALGFLTTFDWSATAELEITVPNQCVHETSNYRWEADKTGTLVSTSADGNIQNDLVATEALAEDGNRASIYYHMNRDIRLDHDRPWSVEFQAAGTDRFVLARNTSIWKGEVYFSKTSSLITFGVYDYLNEGDETKTNACYGLNYSKETGIKSKDTHTYRITNHIFEDGSNMVYLYIDDNEMGPMNQYYHGSTPQNSTSDWLSGKDFLFDYIGNGSYPIKTMELSYVQVWENGKDAPAYDYSVPEKLEPTCTQDGGTVRTCTLCGAVIEITDVEPAFGHSFGPWELVREATCDREGQEKRVCGTCGEVETRQLPKPDHVFPEEWTVSKEATCKAEGEEVKACQNCGEEQTRKLPKVDHNYIPEVVAPTCFAQGYTLHTCPWCNSSYKDTPVNAMGHKPGTFISDGNVTCTKDGTMSAECTRCDMRLTITEEAPGHKFEKGTCSVCGSVDENYTEKFSLYGSSMTLGNALDMNFFVYQSDIEGTDNYAVITKHYADGREDAVVRVEQENWNTLGSVYYYFTFSGVRAKEMADKVEVVIYNADGEAISEVFTDSVQGYARRMLDNPETIATHRTLYIEMLNYGAAAQVEFKYDTGNLANSVITAEEQAEYGMKDRTYVNQRQSDAAYFGTTLTLENQIVFNIFYNGSYVPEGAYAVATFTNHKGEQIEEKVETFNTFGTYQYVSFKSLVVADCSELITVTLYDRDGNVISLVADSIEGYAARMTEVGPLYDAIMKFADAAYQYFHS